MKCEGCKHEADCREQVCLYDFYIKGKKDIFDEIKILLELAISEKPNRTINECEAVSILRNIEKQIKEQMNG